MKQFYNKPFTIIFVLTTLLTLTLTDITPARAGEPDDTIGPINPNLYVCATPDHKIIPLDSDAFGGWADASVSLTYFDETVEVDLDKLEDDCDEIDDEYDARVELLRQTRIEGIVYEFYPDPIPLPSGTRRWIGVPSRDVLVVATGITFTIEWGSEKDGTYFFDYLGAGPITLNLRLPPDGHAINPNVKVMSTSFYETWRVHLGFYRGDIPPPGEFDVFDIARGELFPPANTIFEDWSAGGPTVRMPDVGGILAQDRSTAVIILAAIVLVILPIAGVFKLRQNRFDS